MPKKNSRNELRIIAGRWRSRRIRFPEAPGMRPTPDRVRETLFNWLQNRVAGSRCLDLFAGSGALGLEALSRGAARCVFVEKNGAVARNLRETLANLGAQEAVVHTAHALNFLGEPSEPFDLVFLDPPFASEVLADVCRLLEEGGWLAPQACIYVELPARAELPALPAGWEVLKSQRAGAVGYHLIRRTAPQGEGEA